MKSTPHHTPSALSIMNDNGIRCIASGKHDEASLIFKQSLREVRHQMTTKTDLQRSNDVITVFQSIGIKFGSNIKTQDTLTQDASFEIRDIAFSVKFLHAGEVNLAFGTAALMYNMALNDHLVSLSTGSSKYLKRATCLYKKALQIMLSENGQEKDCGKSLFLLSLCNNLGHCCTNLCDNHGKTTCQEQLEYALSHPECSSYLSREEFEFFHLNSLLASADIKTTPAA